MKVILLTQEDPFYLSKSINDFINLIVKNNQHELVSVIVSKASPFGKNQSFLRKVLSTYNIFGFTFFTFYSFKYLFSKLFKATVSKVVENNHIPLWNLNNNINCEENILKIKKMKPDVIVIIAGNQIIKKEILQIPKFGVINAHSSLLPNYKGLMPTFWVLKNNEKYTGVTLYKLTEGIDDGPIISSQLIEITSEMSQSDLIVLCKDVANKLIVESLPLLSTSTSYEKNHGGSYYSFPKRNDVIEFYKSGKKFF